MHTSIADEDAHFTRVLADLKAHGDILYGAAAEFCAQHRANNAHVLSYLRQLYALEGYAGEPSPRKYYGPPREQWAPQTQPMVPADSAAAPTASIASQASAPSIEDLTRSEESAVALDDDDDELDVDEDADGGVSLLVDHLANVAVVM